MQLNTLNRVIALFLVGGLVVVLAVVLLESDIRKALQPYSTLELGAASGVFLAVSLLSLTALTGSIVDAMGNISVRRLIRFHLGKRRRLAALFLCGSEFDEQDRWRGTFQDLVADDARYNVFGSLKTEMIKPLSAGIFFRTADKQLAEWLVQHHSMYHLSANFVVVLLMTLTWSLFYGVYWLCISSILFAYLLTTFALDNYLYTYQISFRNAYIALTAPELRPGGRGDRGETDEGHEGR